MKQDRCSISIWFLYVPVSDRPIATHDCTCKTNKTICSSPCIPESHQATWDGSNPNSSSNPQTAVITWKQKSPCISECAVNTFFRNYNAIERKRGLGDVGGRGDTVDPAVTGRQRDGSELLLVTAGNMEDITEVTTLRLEAQTNT